MRTLDEMMARMGFAPSDTGRYVTELRNLVARQMSEGMVNRSAGSWAPEHGPAGLKLPAEERARAFLEVEWELERGHFHEVKNFDRNWDEPLTMFGDLLRGLGSRAREFRSRLLGKRNPYAVEASEVSDDR